MVAAANAAVPRITPEEAKATTARGNALVVDVRDVDEVVRSGKIAGALHVPASVLELHANPQAPEYDRNFVKSKTIILYCAAGGRAALGGKMLKDMGYEHVYNLGAFDEWVDSGGDVEPL